MSTSFASHENVSLLTELDRWAAARRTANLWLRDDDAHQPSRALEDLLSRLRDHAAPCLLAVVPMLAEPSLAERLRSVDLVRVAMHGVCHANHAPTGSKKAETPSARGLDAIITEWSEARRRLVGLFGDAAGYWYVPPWNRIEPSVAAALPQLGFKAISTFADNALNLSPPMVQINTHVDVIDWKGGRVGRSAADVIGDVAVALGEARRDGWRPVGVLLHHLVHDAAAWTSLDALLALVSAHPAARWRKPDELLALAAP